MDNREIQKLIDFISKSDLSEVNIETSELKLHIKRGGVVQVAAPLMVEQPVQIPVTAIQPASQVVTTGSTSSSSPSSETRSSQNLVEVKAPMIGTFYRSAGPGKPLFVEVGDEISPGKTICILEAMKLFNEIESEISGKIVKVLVEDATPVEYDQPLFLVELV
ncbi:MAG: acetyl-CoA carboxylase biotin carboxyl carrier protein [Leadbetterella sp.]